MVHFEGVKCDIMQPSGALDARPSDTATEIALSMRQMGVAALPRNYEIFYEVFNGANRELVAAFDALGARPTQEALDEISMKFFAPAGNGALVESAHDQIAARASEIMTLLGRERVSLEKFGDILDQTSDGLEGQREVPRELLQRIVGLMAKATEATLEQSRQVARSMEEKSRELERVKSKLEQYKKLAETDPLTRIWNRRAFDKKIAAIYNDAGGVMFSALILADIDNFKLFNDRHGHPVGDKILQIVAKILTVQAGAGAFVARTGGEEFGLVVEGLSEDATVGIAEQARAAIAEAEFVSGPSSRGYGPITMSLGVCMASDARDPDDLYAKADQALYASKVNGRDRVTRFSSLSKGKFRKNWLLYREE